MELGQSWGVLYAFNSDYMIVVNISSGAIITQFRLTGSAVTVDPESHVVLVAVELDGSVTVIHMLP